MSFLYDFYIIYICISERGFRSVVIVKVIAALVDNDDRKINVKV